MKVFYGDACRADLLQAAGAEQAKLLVVAIDSHDKRMELVDTVRRHFPHLTLLVRAGGRREAYDLLEAGVEHVYREKLDSGLRTGVEALRLLGRRAFQAFRAAQKFRLHDEAAVRELSKMRHDDKLYFHTARQRIGDLEALLLSDLEDPGETRDMGWDTESLREEYGGRSTS
jgi:voltage-gated potassium channel Kch